MTVSRPKRRSSDRQPPAARMVVVMMVTGALIVVAVLGSGIVLAMRTGSNCDRIHRVVQTLDQVMASGEAQVRRYVKEGLLTPEQGVRADQEREKQQLVLRGADCPTP